MGQCGNGGDPAEKNANSAINNSIKQEIKSDAQIYRILLLGPGDSGKTTIIKQMRKIHGQLKDKTRGAITSYIRKKFIENAQILCSFITFDNKDLETARNEVMLFEYNGAESDFKSSVDDPNLSSTLNSIKLLWKDETFRSILEYRGQPGAFQIDSNVDYFMTRIDAIFEQNFTPTDEDYLRFRMRTTGISEETFHVKVQESTEESTFVFIDVGGQRAERKKWMSMVTDNIKAVVYICAISEFDMTLFEDSEANRLQEAFDLFQTVRDEGTQRNKPSFLDDKTITIFLNKYDLFLEKVAKTGKKFAENFDDFEGWYKTSFPGNINGSDILYPEFDKLDMERIHAHFLRTGPQAVDYDPENYAEDEEFDKFFALHEAILGYIEARFTAIYAERYQSKTEQLHFEKTCALNTDQIDHLMKHIQHDLVTAHLRNAGYLA